MGQPVIILDIVIHAGDPIIDHPELCNGDYRWFDLDTDLLSTRVEGAWHHLTVKGINSTIVEIKAKPNNITLTFVGGLLVNVEEVK